ncbi:hypothetical protein GDO78_022113 [Eleutherodactylus coqui]|uniref:Uncharacterized protein n=1 Tax=Eleutherodactylus coqui TaxID=57060 RepID=A0A8J6EC74_ELECQ|nr:hypothetical protein GDO78_022113 [Eleutherodactylus coqui]
MSVITAGSKNQHIVKDPTAQSSAVYSLYIMGRAVDRIISHASHRSGDVITLSWFSLETVNNLVSRRLQQLNFYTSVTNIQRFPGYPTQQHIPHLITWRQRLYKTLSLTVRLWRYY